MSHLNSFSTGLGSQGRPSGDLGNNNIHQYLKLFMIHLFICIVVWFSSHGDTKKWLFTLDGMLTDKEGFHQSLAWENNGFIRATYKSLGDSKAARWWKVPLSLTMDDEMRYEKLNHWVNPTPWELSLSCIYSCTLQDYICSVGTRPSAGRQEEVWLEFPSS